MKLISHTALLLWLLTSVFALPVPAQTPEGGRAPHAELLEEPYLFEVVRHLYRWYMDETDVERGFASGEALFWVRGIYPELDAGDNSRLGEIVLPTLGIHVLVKQSDYTIEKLGVAVRNDVFKIVRVWRRGVPETRPPAYTEVVTTYDTMRDYLFRTRSMIEFPNDALLRHLRLSIRRQLRADQSDDTRLYPSEPQPIHISGISPVANEIWAFWEGGRLLLRYSSDIDLANPDVWEYESVTIDYWDLDEQVVVSLDEVAGSNAYVTRDLVGRAMFNCVILGKRLVVDRAETEALEAKLDEEAAAESAVTEQETE